MQINKLFEGGPAQAIEILGTYLPASSNFFISYVSGSVSGAKRAVVLIKIEMVSRPEPALRPASSNFFVSCLCYHTSVFE